MDDLQKQQLFGNIAAAIDTVPQFIIDRQIEGFAKCDPAYGEGVRNALSHGTAKAADPNSGGE